MIFPLKKTERIGHLADLPFELIRTVISWRDGRKTEGWGKALSIVAASKKAFGEACERYAFSNLTAMVHTARAADLQSYIEPIVLTGLTNEQYRRNGFPCKPLDRTTPKRWVEIFSIERGQRAWVMAECVFHASAFPDHERPDLVFNANSSGCAAGASVEDAVLRALLELVERDAFMRHWFAQRPGQVLRPSSLPGELASRLTRLCAAGAHAGVQLLYLGQAPVAMAWVQDPELHFTCIGTACCPTFAASVDAALLEAELAAYVRWSGASYHEIELDSVRTPADHAAIYNHPRHFRMADRILFSSNELAIIPSYDEPWMHGLDDLCAKLKARGFTAYQLDFGNSELPLHVVRAFVPGLIPIAFGHHLQPEFFDQWSINNRPTIHPLA